MAVGLLPAWVVTRFLEDACLLAAVERSEVVRIGVLVLWRGAQEGGKVVS